MDKICPINPHGNGYCCGEKCMMYDKIENTCAFRLVAGAVLEFVDSIVDYGISINTKGDNDAGKA